MNRLALFLASSISYRGFQCPEIDCRSQWSEMDAEEQLEYLEIEEVVAEWRLKHAWRGCEEVSFVPEGIN